MRERCISRVYENESLRGGKDGVRGYEGVMRGGGGRGRWYSGGWRWWGCALRIYSRQHIHHGGFSWTRNALPWIYICFHPYPNFLPPPSFTLRPSTTSSQFRPNPRRYILYSDKTSLFQWLPNSFRNTWSERILDRLRCSEYYVSQWYIFPTPWNNINITTDLMNSLISI